MSNSGMSDSGALAERCLVATCAHLSLDIRRDDNFTPWLAVLREVLPDTGRCRPTLAALRLAAQGLVLSDAGRSRGNAMARLRVETAGYYRHAATCRLESWRKSAGAGARR